ncbi:MAG: hypothetical protein COS82_04870 [Zetaproteobacteria bacterium CG06_land_8_20_14_3_00_59_53]|nr:MAG: hypothetical protein AUK36_07900 [Zetaproteobacteria bacterium CG2_30_59_37]PIO88946.1 MAG: hypothetical protein COX56_10975 [Zetaproteobacteria bacterium CG23_combo_of_CG06-09_8_20_14_all_59_86]PIQ65250.1 MAG: hypothetical protein COV97_05555 [Zetaproteobacteria bacterium CG11_big_fil_rev_8_21_14_0_20_59_439]PIU70828.1 MAG: hypothetical protein COS82_04870 [Zetaproteobacteria bacterium CG06_land_8_20_14_3_00_59_53]PIU96500.1 MAG: hypothetical protein COS62_09205 [Zetaproteobacteria bac
MNIQKTLLKAIELHQNNNLNEAEKLYKAILAKKPNQPDANYNLGFLAMQTNRPDVALPLFTKALRANPKNPQIQQALAAAKKAAGGQGGLHQQLEALVNRQQYEEALKLAKEAIDKSPDDAYAWHASGTISCLMHDPLGALPYLQKALALQPDDAEAHNALGNAMKDLGRLDEAEASYREAIRIKDYADPYENLFDLLEQSNQMDKLEAALRGVQQRIPGHPTIPIWQAYVLAGKKENSEAYALLKRVKTSALEDSVKVKYHKLLADVAHRLEHYDEAFASYQASNRSIMQLKENSPCDKTRFTRQIDTLLNYFTSARIASWQECSSHRGITPVFVIGFPRSGTTLLDTILRSHSQVTVVEEKPMVDKVVHAFVEKSIDLMRMDDRQCEQLRNIYYQELDKHISPDDRQHIIVDKMPLNIIYTGIIRKIFPTAKFILVLRHPCDSVLSCFMQTFAMNDAMANFSTLEDSASLYNKVMQLWDRYQNVLDMNVFTIKYEDIIDDNERTLKPLLSFLDIPWDDALTNYQETALKRGNINTPSYNQVIQPLYKSAHGRWKSYQRQMSRCLPVLSPWCDYFDYEKE